MNLFQHQKEGIAELVKWTDTARGRILGGCFFLADEMGLGKTVQTILAAQQLWVEKDIELVVVISPASVRSVWANPELGELEKFHALPLVVTEYHSTTRSWARGAESPKLPWVITNYDFIRMEDSQGFNERLAILLKLIEGKRALLVLDESSAVKNSKTKQAKACARLRKSVRRIILLNGTPISNSPLDLFGQARVMDPRIFDMNEFQFKSRYAIKGGFKGRQIVGWRHPYRPPDCCDMKPEWSGHCQPGQGLDEIRAKLKPYVLRREKEDCLDLPPKLPPSNIDVVLTKETWKVYKELRDDMLIWLSQSSSVSTAQASSRAIRLAQVCAGFVGGVRVETKCNYCDFDPMCLACEGSGVSITENELRDVGFEKQKALMDKLETHFEIGEKVLVWCRFRREVQRIYDALYGKVPVGLIWGGQKKDERMDAVKLLDPRTAPEGPAVIIGTPGSGSMGLNLTASWSVIYTTNGPSLDHRLQSMDRVHRIGQTRAVSYYDMIAVGPEGQKTYDHIVVKALRLKNNVAKWTVSAWKQALMED